MEISRLSLSSLMLQEKLGGRTGDHTGGSRDRSYDFCRLSQWNRQTVDCEQAERTEYPDEKRLSVDF